MSTNKKIVKMIVMMVGVMGLFFTSTVFAQAAGTSNIGLGEVANNVTGNLSNIAKLVTAGAYVAGLGFAMAAIFKFMAHKNNPQQVTIGQPIAMLFIATGLLFMPSLFDAAGKSLFGAKAYTAGVGGTSQLPGQQLVPGGSGGTGGAVTGS